MSFSYREFYKYPTCVCLNITDNCNLACKYCFVQQKPHFMDLETGKQAVDFLVKNFHIRKELTPNDDINKVDITFFGGEPTLLWDELIVPLVNYAETKYPDLVCFGMTTNGTMLNEERIQWLKDHNMPFLLSIDGDKDVQDFNRPCRNGESSFDKVSKNIPMILKTFPNTTFRATIYQPTCNKLFETYRFAENCGFRSIFMCPNARESWSEENLNILHNEIHKIMTYFVCSFMEGRTPITCAAIDNAFQKILERDLQVYYNDYNELNVERYVTRCGLGTGSASISFDGKIFSCQEQDSRDTNDFFYIGNIYEGIDVEKHTRILEAYNQQAILTSEDESLCATCKLRQTCIDDICPSVSYDMFKTFLKRPKVDCLYYQWFFEDALIAMDFLVNSENNQLFKDYLDNLFAHRKKEGN